MFRNQHLYHWLPNRQQTVRLDVDWNDGSQGRMFPRMQYSDPHVPNPPKEYETDPKATETLLKTSEEEVVAPFRSIMYGVKFDW